MKGVAKHAGVSVATVSRALHNPELIAPDTLRRVNEAISLFNYSPNSQARSLRTSRSYLLIALVPDISNPFFAEVIRGIEQISHDNGYHVLLGDTRHDPAREDAYASMVSHRQADGIITLLPRLPSIRNHARAPIVNACECVADPSISKVCIDNVDAARIATNYLLTLGHRHVAMIGGPDESPISIDRERGYRRALTEAGLPIEERLIAKGDFSVEAGIRAAERLMSERLPLTAVFCANDETAFGAINALSARGLSVPDDVSVIGFDDTHLARYFPPSLTTVAQPMLEIGREAARLLIELLDEPNAPPRLRIMPTELVVRRSASPPRPMGQPVRLLEAH